MIEHKNKAIIGKEQASRGIEKLIQNQKQLRYRLSTLGGSTKKEDCQLIISISDQIDHNDFILSTMFDIQSFQYSDNKYDNIEIK